MCKSGSGCESGGGAYPYLVFRRYAFVLQLLYLMGEELLCWCIISSSHIASAAAARTPQAPYHRKSRATYAWTALRACLHLMCWLAGLRNVPFSV